MANDIDKTSPHYKGEFGSIYEVNQKFPNGGVAGDYVEIDGWAHYWNADRGTWCVNAQRDSYWDELITGIINKLKLFKGATYMGVAGVSTVPEKIAGVKMYYFANAAGTYSGFGGLQLAQGINVLYTDNGTSWTATPLLEVAQELGVSTEKVMSQKAVNTELGKKADKEAVNTELGKKADKATMDVELGKKADKETVNTELGKKADKADMDVELGKKEDKATVNASLDLKANKSDVAKTNAAQDAEISRKANQQDVERSLHILRQEIGERTVVEGNVSNNPDEEDLTSKIGPNNREVLSLKDREYNPLEFSGKGYKILRKNLQEVTCAITKIQVTKAPTTDGYVSIIINGVETHVNLVASTDNTVALVAKKIANKLSETMDEYATSVNGALVTCTRRFGGDVTASSFSGVSTGSEATVGESRKTELRNLITAVMLNQSNCIYEIRYDFDLDGKTIEVPENCTLKFDGGSLGNGTVKGNLTNIFTSNETFIFDNIHFCSSFSVREVLVNWFKADDDAEMFQKAFDFAEMISSIQTSYYKIFIAVTCLPKEYTITKTIFISSRVSFNANASIFVPTIELSGKYMFSCNSKTIGKWDDGGFSNNTQCEFGNLKFYDKNNYNVNLLYIADSRIVHDIVTYNAKRVIVYYPDYIDQKTIERIWANNNNNSHHIDTSSTESISQTAAINIGMGDNCSIKQCHATMYLYRGANVHIDSFMGFIGILNCHNVIITNAHTEGGAFIFVQGNSSVIVNGYYGEACLDTYLVRVSKYNGISPYVMLNNFKVYKLSVLKENYHKYVPIKMEGGTLVCNNTFGTLHWSENFVDDREEGISVGLRLDSINYINGIHDVIINKSSICNHLSFKIRNTNYSFLTTKDIGEDMFVAISYLTNNPYNCCYFKRLLFEVKSTAEFYNYDLDNSILSELSGGTLRFEFGEESGKYTKYIDFNIVSNKIEEFKVIKDSNGIYYVNNIPALSIDYKQNYVKIQKYEYDKTGVTVYLSENLVYLPYYFASVFNTGDYVVFPDGRKYFMNHEKNKLSCTNRIRLSERPQTNIEQTTIYDENIKKYIIFDGNIWRDYEGNDADANKQGTTTQRPTKVQIGFIYKDTTLGKLIVWDGDTWVNIDGTSLE